MWKCKIVYLYILCCIYELLQYHVCDRFQLWKLWQQNNTAEYISNSARVLGQIPQLLRDFYFYGKYLWRIDPYFKLKGRFLHGTSGACCAKRFIVVFSSNKNRWRRTLIKVLDTAKTRYIYDVSYAECLQIRLLLF